MRHSGLVTSKTSLAFNTWTVETGPLVESNTGIWTDIEEYLAKGKVGAAAQALRSHLEFSSRQLADQLNATVVFRSDGDYELGELLPAVLSRMGDLWGKAALAAQSWGDEEVRDAASTRRKQLGTSSGAYNAENWAVNKVVHYNEWATMGKKDFEPVVAAFKDLLKQFECPKCESWLRLSGAGPAPDTLRCECGKTQFNLKAKAKD